MFSVLNDSEDSILYSISGIFFKCNIRLDGSASADSTASDNLGNASCVTNF